MENVNLGSGIGSGLDFADLGGSSEGGPMLAVTALDATRTGAEAEDLAKKLRSRVVGQDEAIQHIVRTYQTYLAGLSPAGRPIGNFLFLGPTGSGKTRLVEATAECLIGDRRAVIKIDCAEFQHSHEIAKLIGSPPGYLGHRETHPALSQEALNRYHTESVKLSVVLFDEIEKASDALWNLLLGILDKATLTLGDNRRVDFSQAMIFMTSNLGAAEMNAMLRPKLGFASMETERQHAIGAIDPKLSDKMSHAGLEAARRKFAPEFMNRIDKTVIFHPLGARELRRILEIELDEVQERIEKTRAGKRFLINVTDSARDFLLMEGTDVRYGARPLKRAIERLLVQPLSNLIVTGQIRQSDCIRVTHSASAPVLTFFREAGAFRSREVHGVAA
jgi:ATP-dependent Clp protease ATP-binding subunit ClpB